MILAAATLAALLRNCAPAVSADTMRAIVLVESHGYSYAINDNAIHVAYCVPSSQVFPCNREQASKIAYRAIAHGHSIDVGIAQVNLANLQGYHVSLASMLEPCSNLRIGSAILTNAYRTSSARFADQRQALWHAIMAYNSGSLYSGEPYARLVVAAALSSKNTPAVPSIGILQMGGFPEQPRTGSDSGRSRHDPGRRIVAARKPDPRNAPLLPESLPDDAGEAHYSLVPAVEHR